MTTDKSKLLRIFSAFMVVVAMAACEAPTTGTEIHDGDPETEDRTPEEMEDRAEEERENTMEKQQENADIQQ